MHIIRLTTLTICAITSVFGASAGEKEAAPQQGILLATFGTSDPDALAAFENIAAMTRERFPGVPVYWAYTSDFIRKKMARQGVEMDTPLVALSRMKDAGIDEVAIQSLHVIAGIEYEEILGAVTAFQSTHQRFDRVEIGGPLLFSAADIEKTSEAILANAAEFRKPGDMLILMGHGSGDHPADITYVATNAIIRAQDPTACLGTVEGHPTFDQVLSTIEEQNPESVTLFPFMSVAGDHAHNDMAGDEPDSWKSQLESRGIECTAVLQGMGESPEIVEIWLSHLDEAMNQLGANEHVAAH